MMEIKSKQQNYRLIRGGGFPLELKYYSDGNIKLLKVPNFPRDGKYSPDQILDLNSGKLITQNELPPLKKKFTISKSREVSEKEVNPDI